MKPTSNNVHPATYSVEIIDALRELIPTHTEPGTVVHDPFAGQGARLGKLCDELKQPFTGTEIEAPFIVDKRVQHGDSTDWATYPEQTPLIVTSPVYPNGIADHFNRRANARNAKAQASTR